MGAKNSREKKGFSKPKIGKRGKRRRGEDRSSMGNRSTNSSISNTSQQSNDDGSKRKRSSVTNLVNFLSNSSRNKKSLGTQEQSPIHDQIDSESGSDDDSIGLYWNPELAIDKRGPSLEPWSRAQSLTRIAKKRAASFNSNSTDSSENESEEGRLFIYKEHGSEEDGGASIQSKYPIPKDEIIGYFEIEIVDPGTLTEIAIGLSRVSFPTTSLPGWEVGSYGYHGDDGEIYNASIEGKRYARTWLKGDIIGCGIDFDSRHIFFTRNGSSLGIAFRDLPEVTGFYATIGCLSYGAVVKINLGQDPFAFDIASLVLGDGKLEDDQLYSSLNKSSFTFVASSAVPKRDPFFVGQEELLTTISSLLDKSGQLTLVSALSESNSSSSSSSSSSSPKRTVASSSIRPSIERRSRKKQVAEKKKKDKKKGKKRSKSRDRVESGSTRSSRSSKRSIGGGENRDGSKRKNKKSSKKSSASLKNKQNDEIPITAEDMVGSLFSRFSRLSPFDDQQQQQKQQKQQKQKIQKKQEEKGGKSTKIVTSSSSGGVIINQPEFRMPGLGKTTVSSEYVYSSIANSNKYSELIWWIRAETPSTLYYDYLSLVDKISDSQLDFHGRDMEEVIEYINRSLKARSKWLLVFHNAPSLSAISRFIPPSYSGPDSRHVLITSYNSVDWPLVQELTPPRTNDFASLIATFLAITTNSPDFSTSVQQLSATLLHFPIAIKMAASYMKHSKISITAFNKYLLEQIQLGKRSTSPIDGLRLVSDAIFNSFIEDGSPAASSALAQIQLLSLCFPDDIPLAMLDYSEECSSREGLKELEKYGLIRRNDERYPPESPVTISIHRTVQQHVYDKLIVDGVIDKRLEEIATFVLGTWTQRVIGYSGNVISIADESIMAAPIAERIVLDEASMSVGRELAPQLLNIASLLEEREVHKELLASLWFQVGVFEWASIGNMVEGIRLLTDLTALFNNTSFTGELATSIHFRSLHGQALTQLGLSYWKSGKLKKGLGYYFEAYAVYQATIGKDHPYTRALTQKVAAAAADLEQYEVAFSWFNKVLLTKTMEYGDESIEMGITLVDIGSVYMRMGRAEEAQEHFNHSLKIFKLHMTGKKGTVEPTSFDRFINLLEDWVDDLQQLYITKQSEPTLIYDILKAAYAICEPHIGSHQRVTRAIEVLMEKIEDEEGENLKQHLKSGGEKER